MTAARFDLGNAQSDRIDLTVAERRPIADDIILLCLDGVDLPDWDAGAHIELILPSGMTRAYSLVGGVPGRRYEIAVLREPQGRGGSLYLHDTLAEGDVVTAFVPKNSFSLVEAPAYAFFAGGIGITPFIPMIALAERRNKPWILHCFAKTRQKTVLLDRLVPLAAGNADRLSVHLSEQGGRTPLEGLIDALADGTAVYACGPNRLMDAAERLAARRPGLRFHMERFGRLDVTPPLAETKAPSDDAAEVACDPDGAFEVEFRRSGQTLRVEAGQSILDRARTVRQGLSFSCADGYCGTCETAVLAGTPDHRDTVLGEDERAASRTMMICVSRSRTRKLVVDL